jgi:hypothetical protein
MAGGDACERAGNRDDNDAEEMVAQDRAGLAVQRTGGLVAEQDIRAPDNGARDRDALLLSPGQFRGEVTRPTRMFSSVDLPEPDGSNSAMNSPSGVSRSTSRRAWTALGPFA